MLFTLVIGRLLLRMHYHPALISGCHYRLVIVKLVLTEVFNLFKEGDLAVGSSVPDADLLEQIHLRR